MDHEEITAQTLTAFDEYRDEEPESSVAEEEPDEELGEPDEDLDEGEDADAEEGDEAEDEPEGDEEAQEDEEVIAEFPPDVVAFLNKYGGDQAAALKAAAELYHLVGRQGREKSQLAEQVEALQAQLARAQTFSAGTIPFSEEQREWIEEAAQSGNPAGFVQLAVDQGEYDLARAVCSEWAREDPFTAGRVGNQVDQIEQQAQAPIEQPGFDLGRMLETARDHFPDMPAYWGQMSRLIYQLGDEHYLVQAARSGNVEEAAEGIVRLYEMAKDQQGNVTAVKARVKADKREAGTVARRDAQVTSSATSPAREQTPRQEFIMPGLTLEDLEAAFAQQ